MDVDGGRPLPTKPQKVAQIAADRPLSRRPRAQSIPLNPDNYAVGYVYSSEMMSHFSPHGHPEQPARIQEIWLTLARDKLTEQMKWIPIREVRKEEALLVHSEDHWNKVVAIQYMKEQERADSEEYYEQMSLYVMTGTTRSAMLSCGGVVEASLAVARGELKKSFAIVRPPGHHAEPDEHMGFCFFNNVAVAARVVQQRTKLKKILILDWDVHHGNGTQRAFNDDPSVLYISLHRYEQGTFYPCGPFGSMISCGEGPGLGFSVNVPWPQHGMGDAEYIYAFQKVIMPIAMEFAPDLVIISAGFDAAAGDDLGECLVSPAGYAHMTHMLAGLANGRMVVALEGGYNLDSISKSALAVTRVLLGQAPEQLPPMQANEAATETVWLVAREQSKYWKSVDPRACEPREEVDPIAFSIPEILKAHRQHYMYTTHNMMQVPMMTPEQDARFSAQVMCTSDIFENKTLVVFVHEFGNLRLELESSLTCDAHLERSYMLDVSKQLVGWVKSEGYALLDANLFPKPTNITPLPTRNKHVEDVGKDLMTYIWDNYIQLSNAEHIIFIGHGPGCKPLIDLASRRASSVVRTVKAVIQVLGLQKLPSVPSDVDDAHKIFNIVLQCSLVIVPSTHPIMSPAMKPKDIRRHGTIIPIHEKRQLKLIMQAMPAIKEFVKEMLAGEPLANRTNMV
ncbi:hypothetical protein D9613_000736 [Agrocybe pediades]|uniref:histone deacetylase n=1 Tax=Agrocybe pediades TaxID=84607 RepID=A0A8H4VV28_9AGAR|nr:hypothetical protein D9613_000736 [Agrocybe pediades]